jgi:NADPH2:quinone reductase
MAQAIIVEEYGGPENLLLRDVSIGSPGPGQVRLRQTWIGVNYHDIYVRSGLYKTLALPGIPGVEAVGVVEEVGCGVDLVRTGDRVCYISRTYGAYATDRLIDASLLMAIPHTLTDSVVASALLRGLTTVMLMSEIYTVEHDDVVLIQAAAGGVGQLLCQWAARKGALVIGTVLEEALVPKAKAAGCQHVILTRSEDVAERVWALTDGHGADVAYDGVGKATFRGSLDSLAVLGHLVSYGQVSGMVEGFQVSDLASKSLTLSRPILFDYTQNPLIRNRMAKEVFVALEEGWLSVGAPREYPLAKASESHRQLEAEGASSPLLLVP